MKLQIKEICEAQGIKSAYELAKRTKLNMPTAYRAFANDIKQFTPQTLEALCDALKCSPNDIFGYNEPQTLKPQSVPAHTEKPASKPETLKKTVSSDGMTVREVRERLFATTEKMLSREGVRDYIVKGKLKATKGKGNHNFVIEADYLVFETWYKENILKQK
jgi:DNA-binding Xre family transcriptional regulator